MPAIPLDFELIILYILIAARCWILSHPFATTKAFVLAFMMRFKSSTLKHWIKCLADFGAESYILPGLPFAGNSINIRCFRRSDEEARQQWAKFTDPYLMKFNFMPQGTVENDSKFQKLQDRVRLAVTNSETRLIGYISFNPVKRNPAAADFGICFAADHVSRGLGRETLSLVLPWSATSLGLERIVLEVDEINTRAVRLYENFGFKKITEYWCKEDNPVLLDNFNLYDSSPAIRKRRNRIELLTWKMEWKAN